MLSIQPILQMHNIHQIDRQSVIDIITADYNDELHEIRLQYENAKQILDDKYNLAIKQINVMYDAYEVTLGQLYLYKSELLKEKLSDFPDFEYSRFTTKISKCPDTTIQPLSINLDFDIFEVEYSVLACCVLMSDFTKDDIVQAPNDPVKLTFRLDRMNCPTEIKLNNIRFSDEFQSLVIKERDIVVLWKYIWIGSYITTCVNIIKISTGKLIYNNICYDINGKNIPHNKLRFIYCNRQIIYYYNNNMTDHVFISYTIDETSDGIKVKTNPICVIKYDECYTYYYHDRFYGDERGLYLHKGGCIYFIDKLDKYTELIDLQDLDKFPQKFNIKTLTDKIDSCIITRIDYATCIIYINATEYEDEDEDIYKNSYMIALGFSDACNLL